MSLKTEFLVGVRPGTCDNARLLGICLETYGLKTHFYAQPYIYYSHAHWEYVKTLNSVLKGDCSYSPLLDEGAEWTAAAKKFLLDLASKRRMLLLVSNVSWLEEFLFSMAANLGSNLNRPEEMDLGFAPGSAYAVDYRSRPCKIIPLRCSRLGQDGYDYTYEQFSGGIMPSDPVLAAAFKGPIGSRSSRCSRG